MRVTPSSIVLDILPPTQGRSPGVHMSTLYNALYDALYPNKYDEALDTKVMMAMGVAWERYIEELLPSQGINAYRPGEFWTDGSDTKGKRIPLSPDLIISTPHGKRGGEIKFTYMSDIDDLTHPKFGKYVTQMMVYGHHLELPDWTLIKGHVIKTYKERPYEATLRLTDFTFTAEEMRHEWQACLNNGRDVGLI